MDEGGDQQSAAVIIDARQRVEDDRKQKDDEDRFREDQDRREDERRPGKRLGLRV